MTYESAWVNLRRYIKRLLRQYRHFEDGNLDYELGTIDTLSEILDVLTNLEKQMNE